MELRGIRANDIICDDFQDYPAGIYVPLFNFVFPTGEFTEHATFYGSVNGIFSSEEERYQAGKRFWEELNQPTMESIYLGLGIPNNIAGD